MAFQRADPPPFTPKGNALASCGESRLLRPGSRRQAARARNEDVAIVTFDPLPGNLIAFNLIKEYLVDIRTLRLIDIQPCHLGQAYVRFAHVHDYDSMIHSSPHVYDYITLSFVKRNRGRNWKALQFNRECTLILMGFPLDFWEHGYFGRVLNLEQDDKKLATIIVRARVIDLVKVPQWIVLSEGEGFEGES